MLKEVENELIQLQHTFLWDGKRARVSHETMILDTAQGGKQVLDIPARNEAIDLWNLQSYLTQGSERASWCFFVDYILVNFLEKSYLNIRPGQILNTFLQDVHIPISSRTPLPEDVKRMVLTARKYHLQFTAPSFHVDIKLKIPIWKHPGMNKDQYKKACLRDAATCLRLNHRIRIVEDTLNIANRRTVVIRKPHQVNPSGIGRKNCGCPLCSQDRSKLGCENPGQCIETAKMLLNCIFPKWNPTTDDSDLRDELALTPDEMEGNEMPLEADRIFVFDPNLTLTNMNDGFRIFAFEESLNEIPVRRTKIPGPQPTLVTVFLHARILHAGEFEPLIEVVIRTVTATTDDTEALAITFDRTEIPKTFSSALLGGLIFILQNTERNVPLLICFSSDFLIRALVKERKKFENDLLDPKFTLLKAVFARLNERVARVSFKKVTDNQAKLPTQLMIRGVEIDTEIDIMFENPGIPLAQGSQRLFTKIIRKLRPKPQRKYTFVNLDRIRCSIQEASGYTPSDEMIWKSIRSVTLQRLTREFLWKCIHNTFRVGDFWLHTETLTMRGECQTCRVPETLEHIALDCDAPGQRLIWNLTKQLWLKKYRQWPTLNWGLVLGCNLVKFKSDKGIVLPEKGRLFAILVSVAWHVIWNLRHGRVIDNPDRTQTASEIHNRWLKAVNAILTRDRLLTDSNKFGPLAFKKQIVLSTWSGILLDEDSLPDD
jgi:hypothetical protein